MSDGRILVAGIGNIFLGDDGFGVEVVQRLARRALPKSVKVVDFGIRGIDLVYALQNPYERVILVDAMAHGGQPGDLCVLQPTQIKTNGMETHEMSPDKVLAAAAAMGAELNNVLIVGCEPASFGTEDEPQSGLSQAVSAAVEEAVALVESLAISGRMTVER